MVSVGMQIGRWTITGGPQKRGYRKAWTCKCECGSERIILDQALKDGTSKSCGCLMRELNGAMIKKLRTTHGDCKSPEYHVRKCMIARCRNPNNRDFKNYGGRGITVCPEWIDSYEAFLKDMGRRPSPDHTLERINNNFGYFPGNVRWATRLEQAWNKRNNHLITYMGKTRSIAEWAQVLGLQYNTIRDRIRAGWTAEATLTEGRKVNQYWKQEGGGE
jgi:hypothetical protein